MKLASLLNEYVYHYGTEKAIKISYDIARLYEIKGHYSSAVSYYINVINEKTAPINLRYECLIHIALSIWNKGGRDTAVKSTLTSCVSLCPDRPEAYHLLSLLHEKFDEWAECYMYSILSEKYSKNCKINDIGYYSDWSHIFQRAISSWWLGKMEESNTAFCDLSNKYADTLTPEIKQLIINNMKIAKIPHIETKYKYDYINHLIYKFNKSEIISNNYSKTYQDIFILTMLNGKNNGYFLEIGAADPYLHSNTALLEQFNWDGISININSFDYSTRKTKFIAADITQLNYSQLLSEYPNDIDYLQIDCEPIDITYSVLTRIPFHTHRFAVIIFKHDKWANGDEYMIKSREFLKSKGYKLIIANVGYDRLCSSEDWWIHSDLVSNEIYDKFINTTDNVKKGSDILLNIRL
jgi:hypothetical protein